jgi:RNA polymerase sigma factor (sigma-70 family)
VAVRTVETPYEQHRDTVLGVLGRKCSWLAADEREAIFHDAYAVMLEKQRNGVLEPDEMHPRELRAYLIQTAINKALDEGKSAHRNRSQPLGEDALEMPDHEQAPDERAAARLDGARVREIVAELPPRRQAVVKLRFFFERTPKEIQRMLAISARTYRSDVQWGLRFVAERYELVRAGTYCESREELILEYIAGDADAKRAAEARNHLTTCRGCARWAIDLREAARDVGAALPLPALALGGESPGKLSQSVAAAREWAADLLATGKQHATGIAGRLDPGAAGYATGARPGTVAAVVTACIAAGGGATYCAVQGVPEPVRSALPGVSSAEVREEPSRSPSARDRPPPLQQPEPDRGLGSPPPPRRDVAPSQPRETEAAPEPVAPAPAPSPAETEFAPDVSGAPAPPPADASPPGSSPGDTEFAP